MVKDIEAKQGKLDRELLYLLNKAKYYVPKPKANETGMITYNFWTYMVMWVSRAIVWPRCEREVEIPGNDTDENWLVDWLIDCLLFVLF